MPIVCCISLNFWLHVQHTFTHTHARNNCILVKGLWFSIPSNDSNQIVYHVCLCFYFYLDTIGHNRAFSSRYLFFLVFMAISKHFPMIKEFQIILLFFPHPKCRLSLLKLMMIRKSKLLTLNSVFPLCKNEHIYK